MSRQRSEVSFHPGQFAALLAGLTFLLIFAHLATHYLRGVYENALMDTIANFFFLDREMNAPTFFSAVLFVINSSLFLMVWRAGRVRKRPQTIWLILCGLFTFFAVDELLALHENLVVLVRRNLLHGYDCLRDARRVVP